MKNTIKSLGLAAITIFAVSANAAPITVNFERITNNNVEDVASQLQTNIYGQGDAFSTYGLTIGVDQALFTWTNTAVINSNITEVFIDDGTIVGQSAVYDSLALTGVGYTEFNGDTVDGTTTNPGNLPGGSSISPAFVATSAYSADVANGNPIKGINSADDTLGIVYDMLLGIDMASVQTALNDGTLRIGMHVRSIGTAGGSDSFVNVTTVPEPSSLALLALGIIGVGFGRRRLAIRK